MINLKMIDSNRIINHDHKVLLCRRAGYQLARRRGGSLACSVIKCLYLVFDASQKTLPMRNFGHMMPLCFGEIPK